MSHKAFCYLEYLSHNKGRIYWGESLSINQLVVSDKKLNKTGFVQVCDVQSCEPKLKSNVMGSLKAFTKIMSNGATLSEIKGGPADIPDTHSEYALPPTPPSTDNYDKGYSE